MRTRSGEVDYILDLGPGAGVRGGHLVAQGTLDEVLKVENSVTAQYLTGSLKIPTPKHRSVPGQTAPGIFRRATKVFPGWLTVTGAAKNNLNHIDVAFPLGCFTCVTEFQTVENRRWWMIFCAARCSAIFTARRNVRGNTMRFSAWTRWTRRS